MLGRRALCSLLRPSVSSVRVGGSGGVAGRRGFADNTPATATDAAHQDFITAWKKVAPNMEPPKTPLTFMKPRPVVPGSIPTKLTINFVLPYQVELSSKEVDMVIVPATTGQMGILPGHVATIAELKPGLLSVHEGSDVNKYFVSSGFAFIHANSYTDIIAVEAVPLDKIDREQVQKGLAEYTQKLSSASTDLERAEAQIGIEFHSTLNASLSG